MKRDFFRRGVRMETTYGPLEERYDPLGTGHFDLPTPIQVSALGTPGAPGRSRPLEIQDYGQHQYRESKSAVCKPSGGCASISGPEPDFAQTFAMPFPVGTKRRLGPPKTDK
jgi:hypothetical protein